MTQILRILNRSDFGFTTNYINYNRSDYWNADDAYLKSFRFWVGHVLLELLLILLYLLLERR
jgi:hypothetical protein